MCKQAFQVFLDDQDDTWYFQDCQKIQIRSDEVQPKVVNVHSTCRTKQNLEIREGAEEEEEEEEKLEKKV